MESLASWTDANALRRDSRPRGTGDAGAMGAAGNDGETATTIKVLNQALTIARVVALRCRRQYFAALRGHSPALAAAALEHANDARVHAERISERIAELGGKSEVSPDPSAPLGPSEQRDGITLVAVISDHLAAERAAIESYREIAAVAVPSDPTTKRLIEDIVSGEEECASDLASLLDKVSTPIES